EVRQGGRGDEGAGEEELAGARPGRRGAGPEESGLVIRAPATVLSPLSPVLGGEGEMRTAPPIPADPHLASASGESHYAPRETPPGRARPSLAVRVRPRRRAEAPQHRLPLLRRPRLPGH